MEIFIHIKLDLRYYNMDINERLRLDSISIELYDNETDEDFRADINTQNDGVVLNKEEALQLYTYLKLCLKL